MAAGEAGAITDARVLDDLYQVIETRKGGDPTTSHTAKLLLAGPKKIAQKVGEEAVEALIEGIVGEKEKLAEESADLLYHLLVLWASCDLSPGEVWAALERREGVSGLVEKASRGKDGGQA